jgi:hypothetical protein
MDEQDLLLIEQFNTEFQQEEIYSTAVIRDFLNNCESAKYDNPAAYTYNRWNKGMGDIFPLFEWIQRGEYRYLGWNYAYSGDIYHYPQGDTSYVIGEYTEGEYTFYNPEILNFEQWRLSNDNGIQVVGLNSRVTFTSLDGSLTQKKILTSNRDLLGQAIESFDYIHFESNLGQLLINKRVGDTFIFGPKEYRIEEIN